MSLIDRRFDGETFEIVCERMTELVHVYIQYNVSIYFVN